MLFSAATVRKRAREGGATGCSAMSEVPLYGGRRRKAEVRNECRQTTCGCAHFWLLPSAFCIPTGPARLRVRLPARPRRARGVPHGVVVLHRASLHRRRPSLRLRVDVL